MAFFEKKLSNIFGEDSKIVQFLKKKRRKSIYNLVFQVMNRVSVHFDKQSGLIYLTAKTLRPEIGPVLLKTYLDIWIAQNLEENKESARAQTRFAKELRDKAYLAYVKAQKELTEFRKRYQIPGGIKVTRDVDLMLEQNNLEAKVEAAKQRLKETNDLYTNAKMAEAGITSNIKIVQYPEFPVKKTMIKSIKLIIATIVIFFGLGIGVSLGLEFLEGKIRIKSDIEDTIGISVIGQIAKIEE